MHLTARFFAIFLAALVSCPVSGWAAEDDRAASGSNGLEPADVDEPSFPDVFVDDSVRFWAGSSLAPGADFGSVELSLVRPELRFKSRVTVNDSLSVQLTGDFRMSHYDRDGGGALFEDCVDCPDPGNLYATSLGVQGGYLLNHGWSLFRDDEQWALLGALYAGARWEPGAFEESVTPGVSIGLGYQIPGVLRVALTARVERALDGDGVTVGPSGYLRWDFAPSFRLRNRGLGLQLEYRPSPKWEVFVAGFRASDRFRMDDRPNTPAGVTFHDRQVSAVGGLVFKLHRAIRFHLEAGAIVDRKISLDSRDDDRIDSTDGDVSPYCSFRVELRP